MNTLFYERKIDFSSLFTWNCLLKKSGNNFRFTKSERLWLNEEWQVKLVNRYFHLIWTWTSMKHQRKLKQVIYWSKEKHFLPSTRICSVVENLLRVMTTCCSNFAYCDTADNIQVRLRKCASFALWIIRIYLHLKNRITLWLMNASCCVSVFVYFFLEQKKMRRIEKKTIEAKCYY